MTNNRGLLLHVSGGDESHLLAGIRSARNARAQLPDLAMEIVVQGPAVALLQSGSALESELAALGAVPVSVLACWRAATACARSAWNPGRSCAT